jgi:hypothetical protein
MTNTPVNDATLSILCRDVATRLGPPWRLDTSTLGERDRPLTLRGPDGARLLLGFDDWTRAGRVEISGEYPDRIGRTHGVTWHEITVARTRGPQVIAAEIARRLLPLYLPELSKAQAIVARKAREKQTREDIAAQVAAVLPGTRLTEDDARGYPSCDLRLDLPGQAWGSIHLDHDGTAANVTLYRVPAAALPALVAVLRDTGSHQGNDPEKGI